jgi:hypothetical protein
VILLANVAENGETKIPIRNTFFILFSNMWELNFFTGGGPAKWNIHRKYRLTRTENAILSNETKRPIEYRMFVVFLGTPCT